MKNIVTFSELEAPITKAERFIVNNITDKILSSPKPSQDTCWEIELTNSVVGSVPSNGDIMGYCQSKLAAGSYQVESRSFEMMAFPGGVETHYSSHLKVQKSNFPDLMSLEQRLTVEMDLYTQLSRAQAEEWAKSIEKHVTPKHKWADFRGQPESSIRMMAPFLGLADQVDQVIAYSQSTGEGTTWCGILDLISALKEYAAKGNLNDKIPSELSGRYNQYTLSAFFSEFLKQYPQHALSPSENALKDALAPAVTALSACVQEGPSVSASAHRRK